ncbi:MAG: FecR domain-containing protein [Akkermansiaceae bacterium]
MTESQEFELAQLYEKIIAEEATEKEVADFEKAIMNDPAALKLYQDLSFQHSYLRTTQARDAQETPKARKANKLRSLITTITAYTAVAAAVILGAMLLFQTEAPTPQQLTTQPTYAWISNTSLAQWGQCTLPTQIQNKLTNGSLELLEGTATLTFDSGAIVTLEAPAELEVISGMKANVIHGRVVAEVPESAIGFRLDAPDMEVKDLGTVFAVSVDRKSGVSQVDVLDGEVEVFHGFSQDRKLLTTKQRATTNQEANSIGYSDSTEITNPDEISITDERSFYTLNTAMGNGGHATIINSNASTHLHPQFLLTKHSHNNKYSRKFYLKFDLDLLKNKDFDEVSVELTQVRSPFGYASLVPDCEFRIYALNDGSQELWDPEELNWENAPGNLIDTGSLISSNAATVIGTFTIPRGQQEGLCRIKSEELSKLIKQDTNGTLTLVVARKTRETHIGGLVHAFAGNLTPEAEPPKLIFTAGK